MDIMFSWIFGIDNSRSWWYLSILIGISRDFRDLGPDSECLVANWRLLLHSMALEYSAFYLRSPGRDGTNLTDGRYLSYCFLELGFYLVKQIQNGRWDQRPPPVWVEWVDDLQMGPSQKDDVYPTRFDGSLVHFLSHNSINSHTVTWIGCIFTSFRSQGLRVGCLAGWSLPARLRCCPWGWAADSLGPCGHKRRRLGIPVTSKKRGKAVEFLGASCRSNWRFHEPTWIFCGIPPFMAVRKTRVSTSGFWGCLHIWITILFDGLYRFIIIFQCFNGHIVSRFYCTIQAQKPKDLDWSFSCWSVSTFNFSCGLDSFFWCSFCKQMGVSKSVLCSKTPQMAILRRQRTICQFRSTQHWQTEKWSKFNGYGFRSSVRAPGCRVIPLVLHSPSWVVWWRTQRWRIDALETNGTPSISWSNEVHFPTSLQKDGCILSGAKVVVVIIIIINNIIINNIIININININNIIIIIMSLNLSSFGNRRESRCQSLMILLGQWFHNNIHNININISPLSCMKLTEDRAPKRWSFWASASWAGSSPCRPPRIRTDAPRFLRTVVQEINHPEIRVAPWLWNPPYIYIHTHT